MARQNRSKQAEAPAEENVATEAQTEAPAEASTEASTEIDLTGFEAAVNEALAKGDGTTGEVPAEAVESVNAVYRELEGQKGKNAARKLLEEMLLGAVAKLDAVRARSISDLKTNLSAGGGTAAPKAPADPTAAFVQRVASLQLAYGIVTGNVPEKVSEDWTAQVEKLVGELADQVTAYGDWMRTEVAEGEEKPAAPEVSPVVRAAFKLSTGKSSGGRSGGSSSGVRRDINKHVSEAFASVESGAFLSVADIAKFKSTEYGDDTPSQGAISARLFPESGKCTIEGIVPVDSKELDGKNPKGARKA